MKIRLMITACCVAFLCGVTPAFAQNRLDVILEGPWILYEDHDFHNGTNKVDVLIAMTPGVAMPHHPHQPPVFSTGDGVVIGPGIHCVVFDKSCAMARQAHALSPHDYSQLMQPTISDAWNWFTYNSNKGAATFLIFPMPDSLRNDGVYHMRFAPPFDDTGKTSYGKDEQHSIGVILHYKNGPQKLSLAPCNNNGTSINATDCPKPGVLLDNTDTLQVVMRAPENNNACDPHVRSAYPEMLNMIGGSTQNPDIGVIDPAVLVKNGKGLYADDTAHAYPVCYQCDPQNPKYDNNICSKIMPEAPSEDVASLLANMDSVITALEGLPAGYPKKVYAPQLRKEFNDLDKLYPSISQLLAIKLLLGLSADQIADQIKILEDAIKADTPSTTAHASSTLVDLLERIEAKERTVAAAVPTKNGGDCRAPVMIVK